MPFKTLVDTFLDLIFLMGNSQIPVMAALYLSYVRQFLANYRFVTRSLSFERKLQKGGLAQGELAAKEPVTC